jgi:hypothetical protein
MRRKLHSRRPSHATVVAYLALFVALATGGAYAANTIRSTDIVNGEVKTPDLASLGVTNPKLSNGAVTSAKVLNNSLTGADLAPSALPQGRAVTSFCNPESAGFEDCGAVTINLARTSRVLIAASGMWYSVSHGPTRGICRIEVDGAALGPSAFPGQLSDSTDSTHEQAATLNNVTPPLAAGSHTFGLACSQEQGNIDLDETFVSVAVLSAN